MRGLFVVFDDEEFHAAEPEIRGLQPGLTRRNGRSGRSRRAGDERGFLRQQDDEAIGDFRLAAMRRIGRAARTFSRKFASLRAKSSTTSAASTSPANNALT